MKTRLALVVAACGLAVLANSSVVLPGIGEATVVCAEENGWTFGGKPITAKWSRA